MSDKTNRNIAISLTEREYYALQAYVGLLRAKSCLNQPGERLSSVSRLCADFMREEFFPRIEQELSSAGLM